VGGRVWNGRVVNDGRVECDDVGDVKGGNRFRGLPEIFVAAAFVFLRMEFDVGGYERTVT
jgi:hypothetical protein